MLTTILRHLETLVAFDTRNPPRQIGTAGIFDYLRMQLPDFRIEITDNGGGAVSMLAVRGNPRCVFNVHLDTVPTSPAWTGDPFVLRVTEDRAMGLGACDIKGAVAGLLTAVAVTNGDTALLFSTDEEADDSRCLAAFLASTHGFAQAVVAEPTGCKAVLAHRGISSVRMRLLGRAGHSSGSDANQASALHQAVRWGNRALELVEAEAQQRFGRMSGLRFNIGRVEGGIKANVIAPSAEIKFGFRPLPSMPMDDLHARFKTLVDAQALQSYEETFRGPSLPSGNSRDAEARRLAAENLAIRLALPIGDAVDFWTEAALFSAVGLIALVYGPGDIAQAHTADEWVTLDQLQRYTESIIRILT